MKTQEARELGKRFAALVQERQMAQAYERLSPVTVNDPALGRRVLPYLTEALGGDNILEVLPTMGGEDFAYFTEKVPGFYYRLGVRNPSVPGSDRPLHTPDFSPDEQALPVGIRSMSHLVLRYLGGE